MNLKERIEKLHPKLINNETLRVNGNYFRQDRNKELRIEIESIFEKYDDMKMNEMLYLVNNNMIERPKCECNIHGVRTFISYKDGYYNYCGKPGKCDLNSKAQATKMLSKKESMTEDEKLKMLEKQKKTTLKNHGVDNYFKKKEFIERNYSKELVKKRDKNRIKSVQEKYGVDNVFQLESTKETIKETNIEKYGVSNYMQTFLSEDALKKLNNKEWMDLILDKYSMHYVSKKLECCNSTIETYAKKHNIKYVNKNISTEEYLIIDILEKHSIKFIRNDKSVLKNNHELDFYLPDYNLAIEVNGLYWHSERIRTDRNYHQSKYDLCKEQNITLLQFWDFEINNKIVVIESIIVRMCDKYDKESGYTIKQIDNTQAALFINENHLNNITDNNINKSLGAFIDNELIAVIAIKTNKSIFNIVRICIKNNMNLENIFYKFILEINKNNKNIDLLIESDNRHDNCIKYENHNFEKINTTKEVDYKYTFKFKELLNKNNFLKSDLRKINNFNLDESKTVKENMLINGYYRVYGCKIDTWKYTK